MNLGSFFEKARRTFNKVRLRPISVFCLHHVSLSFNSESMCDGDWMPIESFKSKVLELIDNGIHFISLQEAHLHIRKDIIRYNKYAVLSFDDGYSSLKEIIPWLEENKIPVVLFINGKYLDGLSYRDNSSERYLTRNDLDYLDSIYIEIGSHGWEHIDATKQSADSFDNDLENNLNILSLHPRFIPFHAYTWGRHTLSNDLVLKSKHLIPVLMDGLENYNDKYCIHRLLLQDY